MRAHDWPGISILHNIPQPMHLGSLIDKSVMLVARGCSKYLNWSYKNKKKPPLPIKSFDMNVSNDKASAVMTFDDCPGLQALVVEAAKMMTEFDKAENFLEMDLSSACEMHNNIRLTIQWADKKSPGRLVAELKEELAELKEDLAEVLDCAEKWARAYSNESPQHMMDMETEDKLYQAVVKWMRKGKSGKA